MTETISPPKDGTKEAQLVSALNGKGATIVQLSGLLHWQPHTVRAAMTRLRGRGYIIDRVAKTNRSAAKFKIRKVD
ncbi:DUF3489 domain-containing protein [Hyphomonas sp. FCG-A18]|uniref:DUF3489 domain-containing protein n=1 Tax=Hyphomonas sp. FCG-A18 TaxID=3080019 RepID=UPI002B2AA06B|nr:DUF3489 domain-containing protein [Hyphomonas sp. FCG-A18]